MSKAEERALEAYPKATSDICGIVTYIGHPQYMRDLYIEGYHQAEKDMELTNADVYDIWRIYNEVCAEGEIYGTDETSQEVLKRFKKEKHINDQKEEKVWQTK